MLYKIPPYKYKVDRFRTHGINYPLTPAKSWLWLAEIAISLKVILNAFDGFSDGVAQIVDSVIDKVI